MNYKKFGILVVLLLQVSVLFAKDYPASFFGIKSDGVTLNTRSIQFGIDYIQQHGGGRLVFWVGRYLTGSIHLKSNVSIHLKEGAVLVGSTNPFNYDKDNWYGLILANGQENIAITGKGIIDGKGRKLANNFVKFTHYGLIKDSLKYDRNSQRPAIVYFRNCKNVNIENITLKNSAFWVQVYNQCQYLTIDSIHVNSTAYWNNDGIDIVDCLHVVVKNSYINAADDGICLKSFDAKSRCEDILIKNCTVRSSANGIKFGTSGFGGFSNIKIINNIIYDTYRSAVALEIVDGGVLKNVIVDSMEVRHTGNLIFLRIGERREGRIGSLSQIKFSNINAEIAADKPDAGYDYEGPIEDMPRNISPAIILTGLPGHFISDVTFENIEVTHPGGGDSMYAQVPLDSIGQIPELRDKYPDFSMFEELPAWAVYARHVKNLHFSNIVFKCKKKDFRVPVAIDDVHKATFRNVTFKQPDSSKFYYKHNADNIKIIK